jgi:drug/metabolite transporter (DMT)-like permease
VVILSAPTSAGAAGAAAVPVVVLLAAVLHAIWNALAHGMKDKLVGFALINVAIAGCAAVLVCFTPLPNAAAWPFIIASGLLQVVYQALLLRAYRLGDFAQMYPLARGTSPLLVAVWSTLVLSQSLVGLELVGVLVVSLGLVGLAFPNGIPSRAQLPALAAAVGTGVTIAAYTIVDGTGVRQSSTVTGYIAWMFLLQGPLLLGAAFTVRGRGLLSQVEPQVWFRGLSGGVLCLLAYGLVVWAQARGNLATIAALRETSIVIAALIGTLFFHERFGRFRMAASAVVVLGIAALEIGHG